MTTTDTIIALSQGASWNSRSGADLMEPTTTPPDDRRCTKKSKQSQQRCRRWAAPGQDCCVMHGANSPGARINAQKRLRAAEAEAEAKAVLAHEGITPVLDPIEELGVLTSEVLALKDALARRVNSIRGELSTTNQLGTDALRVDVELYERALDRSGKFLDMLVRNGFEEKRIRITQAQASLVARAVEGILDAAGLTAEQYGRARAAAAVQFRALEGEAQ